MDQISYTALAAKLMGIAPEDLITNPDDLVVVRIVDMDTSETVIDSSHSFYYWTEGNGACDCNRAILFGHDPDSDVCLGCHRYYILSAERCSDLRPFNQDYPPRGKIISKICPLDALIDILKQHPSPPKRQLWSFQCETCGCGSNGIGSPIPVDVGALLYNLWLAWMAITPAQGMPVVEFLQLVRQRIHDGSLPGIIGDYPPLDPQTMKEYAPYPDSRFPGLIADIHFVRFIQDHRGCDLRLEDEINFKSYQMSYAGGAPQ